MRSIGLFGVALAVGLAMPALATDVVPPSADSDLPLNGRVALSDAEREATINAAADRNSDLPINGAERKIHGEMGIAMGSHGYRSIYGTTVIPLGETGTMALSYSNTQFGGYRRR